MACHGRARGRLLAGAVLRRGVHKAEGARRLDIGHGQQCSILHALESLDTMRCADCSAAQSGVCCCHDKVAAAVWWASAASSDQV